MCADSWVGRPQQGHWNGNSSGRPGAGEQPLQVHGQGGHCRLLLLLRRLLLRWLWLHAIQREPDAGEANSCGGGHHQPAWLSST